MFFRAFAALAIALTVVSCAKTETEDAYDIEQRSLDAWVAANHPDAVRFDNGVHIEWQTTNPDGALVQYGNWFRLNYTGRTLDGKVFKTRFADIARRENTFTLRTNYVPDFINYYELNGLTNGENFSIGQMREGEKVIAYIPSRLGYQGQAKSFTNGYGGHFSIYAAMIPMQIEMELVEVLPDATVREKRLLDAYAQSIGMAEEDKIEDGLYVKIISEPTTNQITTDDNIITEDQTAYIYLSASVIQENSAPDYDPIFETFLVDTNIASEAREQWKDYTPFAARAIIPKHADDTYIPAFKKAFENRDIKWQSHFRILTSSEFAYSDTGNEDADLAEPFGVVEPFTPMVIDVYVQRKEFQPGDEPDTEYGQPVE